MSPDTLTTEDMSSLETRAIYSTLVAALQGQPYGVRGSSRSAITAERRIAALKPKPDNQWEAAALDILEAHACYVVAQSGAPVPSAQRLRASRLRRLMKGHVGDLVPLLRRWRNGEALL